MTEKAYNWRNDGASQMLKIGAIKLVVDASRLWVSYGEISCYLLFESMEMAKEFAEFYAKQFMERAKELVDFQCLFVEEMVLSMIAHYLLDMPEDASEDTRRQILQFAERHLGRELSDTDRGGDLRSMLLKIQERLKNG